LATEETQKFHIFRSSVVAHNFRIRCWWTRRKWR